MISTCLASLLCARVDTQRPAFAAAVYLSWYTGPAVGRVARTQPHHTRTSDVLWGETGRALAGRRSYHLGQAPPGIRTCRKATRTVCPRFWREPNPWSCSSRPPDRRPERALVAGHEIRRDRERTGLQ